MGTRSLTRVLDSDEKRTPITCLYRQFDGYPAGMGRDLAKILAPLRIVNGHSGDPSQANGMGCLAARLVKGLKADEPGNVYIHPAKSRDCDEEFEYQISVQGAVEIEALQGGKPVRAFVQCFEVTGQKRSRKLKLLLEAPADRLEAAIDAWEKEQAGEGA